MCERERESKNERETDEGLLNSLRERERERERELARCSERERERERGREGELLMVAFLEGLRLT